jgi:hypothetical protein
MERDYVDGLLSSYTGCFSQRLKQRTEGDLLQPARASCPTAADRVVRSTMPTSWGRQFGHSRRSEIWRMEWLRVPLQTFAN